MADGDNTQVTMTEGELKAVISSTVKDTLTQIGIDHAEPLDMQKDFSHLRKSRESVEAVKKKAWLSAVGFIVVLALGALFRVFTPGG